MLNNKGWGLKAMLVIVALILIAGFISYCLYMKMFGSTDIMNSAANLESKNNTSEKEVISYSKEETDMQEAVTKYIKNEDIDMSDVTVMYIKLSILVKNGYVKEITSDNVKCSGYVKVTESSKKAYLKCPNYTTSGYESEYDN